MTGTGINFAQYVCFQQKNYSKNIIERTLLIDRSENSFKSVALFYSARKISRHFQSLIVALIETLQFIAWKTS